MGAPKEACRTCSHYERAHRLGGPHGYGACAKHERPVHGNETGCADYDGLRPRIEGVLQCCPVCGPINCALVLDGHRFCPRCAAVRLREAGVPTLEMRRVPRGG